MKKVITLLLFTSIMRQAFTQTQTFDIATYTPPRDWKKDVKPGVVNYIDVNEAAGSFCVITLYASKASTGDAQKDFKKEWKDLVVTPYKGASDPKTETQTTADGWKVVVGAAPIKKDGTDVYIILSVFSGFGKTLSVRTSLNNQSYTATVDALLATIVLDKTKTATMNPSNTTPVQTTTGKGKFGLLLYNAPAGWSHQIFSDGIVFKTLDLPADEQLAIQIMQPIVFAGTIQEALAKSYDEAAIMYKSTKMDDVNGGNYQIIEARKSFNGWEYIQGSGGIQVENGTPYKTELGLDLFVIKAGNRFERVAILKSRKNCNMSRYYSTDRLKYKNAIDTFLFSLQLTDNNESALTSGAIQGTGITGVWQGISLSVGPTSTTEMLGERYKVFSPIFLANGQAFFWFHISYRRLRRSKYPNTTGTKPA